MTEKDIKKIICKIKEIKKAKRNNSYWEELCFGDSPTRADVVIFRKNAFYAFEIKSDSDIINERFEKQIDFYNLIFQYNTLLLGQKIMKKKIAKIIDILPTHWGIAWVEKNKMFYLREPEYNNFWSKTDLLLFLWQRDLIKLANEYKIYFSGYDRKNELADKIASKVERSKIPEIVYNFLLERKKRKDRMQELFKKREEEKIKSGYYDDGQMMY